MVNYKKMLDIEEKWPPYSGPLYSCPGSIVLLQALDPNAPFISHPLPTALAPRATKSALSSQSNFIDPFYMPYQSQGPTNSLPALNKSGRATALTALNSALLSSSLQQKSSDLDQKAFFQPSASSQLRIAITITAPAQPKLPKASFVKA